MRLISGAKNSKEIMLDLKLKLLRIGLRKKGDLENGNIGTS